MLVVSSAFNLLIFSFVSQFKQKLSDTNVTDVSKLQWRKHPDGRVFIKEHQWVREKNQRGILVVFFVQWILHHIFIIFPCNFTELYSEFQLFVYLSDLPIRGQFLFPSVQVTQQHIFTSSVVGCVLSVYGILYFYCETYWSLVELNTWHCFTYLHNCD